MSEKKLKINEEDMNKKINELKEYFYSRTYDGYIINYINGFIGVGILNTPQDHLTKDVNDIWFLDVGSNRDGSDIIEISNVEMDLEEAKDTYKALGICIKKYKKEKKKNKKAHKKK